MRAKKSLGQHWLRAREPLEAMLMAGRVAANDVVLEIGPGLGILTAALLARGATVVAVEKDARLIAYLEQKFASVIKEKRLELIPADIFKFDFSYKLRANAYKLVANIPYYLTGQILRQFLTDINQPQSMTLMVQKEIAERIVAHDNKESVLSMSVKCYGQPHYIQTVPAASFEPQPKVDSAILFIDKISKNNFRDLDEKKFFALLKQGFAGKRKMLKNNLNLSAEKFAHCQVSSTARAENVTLKQWLCLAKNYA